ncbi:sugar transferase [Patescibacteria group bacterium]|nr:sugar transferase [Patescibacteria group bacterium]
MTNKLIPSPYHFSFEKKLFDFILSVFGLVALSPILIVISIMIKLTSKGPVFFTQKRVGKDGRVFTFIKFRTMVLGAERLKWRYRHLNEADGPVFKIKDDPRFTNVGKFLARTGLDELPQLINVLKGDMSLVGPRPLPVPEAKKLTPSQKERELVKPGITSNWVVKGAHNLSFDEWMRLDIDYVENGSLFVDLKVLVLTATLILKSIPRQLLKKRS